MTHGEEDDSGKVPTLDRSAPALSSFGYPHPDGPGTEAKPGKFGGLANARQESWKAPLPEFIEELYFKHFKKSRPENVRSIEQIVRDANRKKAELKARKQAAHLSEQSGEDPLPPQ